jgi:folate-binding protein YgfZ
MLTNDIATIEAGQGCYAAYLTQQGRMLSDMRVLELGDVVLLDLEAPVAPAILQKLDQFVFTEDVKLGDLTDAFGLVSVVGPQSAHQLTDVLRAAGGTVPAEEELRSWPEFRNARTTFRGEMVLIVASREIGIDGFDLFIERAQVEALTASLVQAGVIVGSDAAEVLRIESGRPRFTVDMDAETIPLEAGIDARAISFTKGCYPGQEVIVRVVHRGHGRIAKRLLGLVAAGDRVPSRGALLTAGDRDAGRVTSAVWSPKVGAPIALAYVQRDFVEPGTELTIVDRDARIAARVSALPFTA